MMNYLVVLIFGCVVQVQNQSVDAKAFAQIVEAQSMNGQEFYLEYEGRSIILSDFGKKSLKLADDGVSETYSGSFRTKGPSATIVDIFQQSFPKNHLLKHTLASLNGNQESRFLNDPAGKSSGQMRNSSPQEFNITGSYGRIFLLGQLKNLLQSRADRFRYEDSQIVQGRKCEVVSFDIGSEKYPVVHKFWIDFGRGCHPIQYELYLSSDLADRTTVELKEFKDSRSRPVWLPVSGRWEAFHEMGPVKPVRYLKSPSQMEEMAVVQSTIRFSDPSPDDSYKVKFAKGTFINDRIRQTQYEFGQQGQNQKPPETRAEAEKRLNEMLNEARQEKTILEASSQPTTWLDYQTYLLIFFFALGSIATIVLVVRMVKGRYP